MGELKMEQTISFTGLQTNHASVEEALEQIWTCIRASSVATAATAKNEAFQAFLAEGNVSVAHDFDGPAGTLTVTRTWDADAWNSYIGMNVDMQPITDMLAANGITASGL